MTDKFKSRVEAYKDYVHFVVNVLEAKPVLKTYEEFCDFCDTYNEVNEVGTKMNLSHHDIWDAARFSHGNRNDS